jgi:tRNA A37 threonylcarbamoyltransferase TsaD
MCKERGVKCFIPPKDLLTDNGGMIAFTGEILFNNGEYATPDKLEGIDINPRQRTDEVEIKYK